MVDGCRLTVDGWRLSVVGWRLTVALMWSSPVVDVSSYAEMIVIGNGRRTGRLQRRYWASLWGFCDQTWASGELELESWISLPRSCQCHHGSSEMVLQTRYVESARTRSSTWKRYFFFESDAALGRVEVDYKCSVCMLHSYSIHRVLVRLLSQDWT